MTDIQQRSVVTPAVSIAEMLPNLECPVGEGSIIPFGWKNIFWRTVLSVGEPVFMNDTWLVPVQYQSYYFGIVRYRLSQASMLRLDEVTSIRPNTSFVRALLKTPISMPSILPDTAEGILRVSVDHTDYGDPDEDGQVDFDQDIEKTCYVLNLFGIIGARNRRNDFAERFELKLPASVAEKWN